jgi:hypothetical protein
MLNMTLRPIVLATVLLLGTTVSGPAKTNQTSFDGSWSVVIMTDAGTCQ